MLARATEETLGKEDTVVLSPRAHRERCEPKSAFLDRLELSPKDKRLIAACMGALIGRFWQLHKVRFCASAWV
jgi:hypothetical protein